MIRVTEAPSEGKSNIGGPIVKIARVSSKVDEGDVN
jgi:hypothetical protein